MASVNQEIMENFTNESIDTTQLPRFETVPMRPLEQDYFKVVLVGWVVTVMVASLAVLLFYWNIPEFSKQSRPVIIAVACLLLVILFFARLAFRKKAYAFRQHDVLYRHGVIATTTVVIPYNRVQHVALHEGLLSRIFGLATVEIFTAGGSSSDIAIPGIKKGNAEDIKQLLMGKIQKIL